MSLTRRGFLGLAVGATAAALAPKAVASLIEPNRRIFLPPRGGWPTTFTTRYVHRTYELAYSITKEVIEDGDCVDVADIARQYSDALARSMLETKEALVENILNMAFSDNPRIVTRPTTLIVASENREAAERLLNSRRSWLARLVGST